MAIFATLDNEANTIAKDAHITRFDNEAEAREYIALALEDVIADAEADGEPVELIIEPGNFSDCWIKTWDEPDEDDLISWCKPFHPEELIVRQPGTHPGGKAWWIEPGEPVLVGIIEPLNS